MSTQITETNNATEFPELKPLGPTKKKVLQEICEQNKVFVVQQRQANNRPQSTFAPKKQYDSVYNCKPAQPKELTQEDRESLRCTQPCNFRWVGCLNKNCTYAHTLDELRVQQCKFNFRCTKESCVFSHGGESLKDAYKRAKVKIPAFPKTRVVNIEAMKRKEIAEHKHNLENPDEQWHAKLVKEDLQQAFENIQKELAKTQATLQALNQRLLNRQSSGATPTPANSDDEAASDDEHEEASDDEDEAASDEEEDNSAEPLELLLVKL